jgi:PadR family transcriptional regulator PadR
MKRKPGSLLPLESKLLIAVLHMRQDGQPSVHGYAVAKVLAETDDSRRLTSQGTLYKALDRLTVMGLLGREWEEPSIAEAEGRPRRRLYHLTSRGEQAIAGLMESASPVLGSAIPEPA